MKKNCNTTIVTVGGITLSLLGIFHIACWQLFDWKNELPKLNQVNN